MEIADWLTLLGIIINSVLAIWIVKTIQNKLTNKRILKDYFINELKEVRGEYKVFFNNIYNGSVPPKIFTPWFKLMNIKLTALLNNLHKHYNLNPYFLDAYKIILPDLIVNDPDFIRQFRNSTPVIFSEQSKLEFIKFQQQYNGLFTDLIIEVNNV